MTTAGVVETAIPEYGQEMDGGLTHTPEATYFRSWNFTWTAPADDTETAEFTIYGNAVSGGDGSGGPPTAPYTGGNGTANTGGGGGGGSVKGTFPNPSGGQPGGSGGSGIVIIRYRTN